jgi:hypothetical protein
VNVIAMPPAECRTDELSWSAGPLPTAWPGDRYLVVYDGVGHEFASAGGQRMALDMVTFVLAKLQ